ncbi:MAG: hypothetical protein N2Z21_10420 [Candidatus Sumerlaeaceae bacterium]|nr:hypothetical protein [Candidatus Sumerlaeaceae bacterium]
MSTILKALEKARRERAQTKPEQQDSPELLKPAPPAASPVVVIRRKPRWGLVVASILASTVLTLLALVVALMFLQNRMAQWAQNLPPTMPIAPATLAPQGDSSPGSTQPPQSSIVARAVPSPAASSTVSPSASAQPRTPVPIVDLPTPVPMSELMEGASPAAMVPAPQKASSEMLRGSPTPPLGAGSASARPDEMAGFVLGPILYDPRSPMAIVNGQSVREGGVYENFRVLKITPDSVTVQRAGETPVILRKRR